MHATVRHPTKNSRTKLPTIVYLCNIYMTFIQYIIHVLHLTKWCYTNRLIDVKYCITRPVARIFHKRGHQSFKRGHRKFQEAQLVFIHNVHIPTVRQGGGGAHTFITFARWLRTCCIPKCMICFKSRSGEKIFHWISNRVVNIMTFKKILFLLLNYNLSSICKALWTMFYIWI